MATLVETRYKCARTGREVCTTGTPTAPQSEPLFTVPCSPSSGGESLDPLPGNLTALGLWESTGSKINIS